MSSVSGVLERYSEGAKSQQADLCCPVDYDRSLLKLLPQEIIDRDYGCGDPSRYVKEGDVVLDLGSGGGKICYMAAQIVGDSGHVHGVDMNDDMLGLARQFQGEMADKLGGDRVTFHKGTIQDLALSYSRVETFLQENPLKSANDVLAFQNWKQEERRQNPMIADNSVDLVVSNCVLNLVGEGDRSQMISEIFRVLKPGGRVAISDIVADEPVPQEMKDDDELWSGCISGAFGELEFMDAFAEAGFVAVSYDKWEAAPWKVVGGIEFRSVTLEAVKPSPEECIDHGHAVIYKGPFSEVYDDEEHVYYRGERMAVCERTFKLLMNGPYADNFIGIEPAEKQPARTWCAPSGTRRPVSETKGGVHDAGAATGSGCC